MNRIVDDAVSPRVEVAGLTEDQVSSLAKQLLDWQEKQSAPVCQWCEGYGFYTINVSVKHPLFGEAITCGCKPGGTFPKDFSIEAALTAPSDVDDPIPATPCKVGKAWGAKVLGKCKVGDLLNIQAKSGKEWTARVAKIVSEEDGDFIVETVSEE